MMTVEWSHSPQSYLTEKKKVYVVLSKHINEIDVGTKPLILDTPDEDATEV